MQSQSPKRSTNFDVIFPAHFSRRHYLYSIKFSMPFALGSNGIELFVQVKDVRDAQSDSESLPCPYRKYHSPTLITPPTRSISKQLQLRPARPPKRRGG